VLGTALQRDGYRAHDVPAFDYTYVVPGVFAQDDYVVASRLTVSASGRIDHHSRFGTFASPRVSALVKLGAGWTLRPSAGSGFFAPTPFTEETEATGLSRLAPLDDLEAEQGRSVSIDLGWKRGPIELTATWFQSVIDDPVLLTETPSALASKPVQIVNAPGPTRTRGSEFIARWHHGQMDLIATHMFVWATEVEPADRVRREVELTPRHTGGVDWLSQIGNGRIGIEVFYTGRQQLRDSPYRPRTEPYVLWGVVGEWRIGRARLFLNAENLADVRQTEFDPFVRPSRRPDGRWTEDVWMPLEGRVLNGGVRLGF
jgi:iron complex outermembrane receptor protein